ncbi:MAG: hypothetical protein ACXW1Y_01005 [Acidimicrobiia bacterium]
MTSFNTKTAHPRGKVPTGHAFGSYIGYRVGIDVEGRWNLFVAGD